MRIAANVFAIVLLGTAGCSAALANVLDLPGMYGNAAGCNWLFNEDRDDDSLVALTGNQYETYSTGCEFVQAAQSMDGDHVVTMLCSHEGEAFKSIDFMRIVRADGRDAYELYSRTGEAIAAVERCE